ncbi:Glutathione s-transferase kappa 2 [Caenorhabditis elegans]|uniref:Glutathione s-transferase kappa 2 n=1 Tax=Caenorhabditis elegans TaxID=6239 RepID=GSTK2_CAEEL|nr:Glutathione s-transferase kappa 2 [Caenorhabditis elegans]Q18973.1 RecName: Full=Glutathione s-transferase kappa 2 [Caenorhabditis elegans]CCD63360.1 Glutathione s-transferase kappa 2 [Caenorhabditis elegans]|eukprot:NP_501148.1 Glutathione s-transferase kappa 2 [Caenorhabditis elegans]
MPNRKVVKFFFDVISPYSYFGFEGITRHRSVWKTPIQMKPFFFAGVVRHTENPGLPLRIPIKEKYMHKDLLFSAQYWGIPFRLPKDYTNMMLNTSSIVPQRILVASQLRDNVLMEDVARGLWHRFYAYGKPIFTKSQVAEVLRDLHVKDVDELVMMSDSAEVKNILRENTDEAIGNGCFGAPWMHITDGHGKVLQTVFGSDRLPQVADFLAEPFKGPMREKKPNA